ncbi:MAG: hypothetical protein KatS3mg102_2939 [Planctomycetota bacterium]|nr:MAG: hypothetical protein KatS3mg102_2939 [Planctomycetota bacterium]
MAQRRIERPDRHQYYMGIALAVRRRANCLGSRVGAVLVRGDRVMTTGYNGTPAGMPNCDEGGCERCARPERFGSGRGYDVCICVHAEQNALLSAARFGIALEGAALYTTMRPCFGCAKELLQAQVREVYYLHDWRHPDPELRPEYERLQSYFAVCQQVALEDPEAAAPAPQDREPHRASQGDAAPAAGALRPPVEIALFTGDVERAANFYTHLLGCPPAGRGEGIAVFAAGQLSLLVHRRHPPLPDHPPAEDHVAFGTSELDATCAALARAGLELLVPPRRFDWGRSAYLRDPDGRLVELHEV